MKIEINKTYLITTDEWFFAPDGQTYRAVFGKVTGIHSDETALGIKTNDRSTNWYVTIGNMIIAGCQVHYCIKTNKVDSSSFRNEMECGGRIVVEKADSRIYLA